MELPIESNIQRYSNILFPKRRYIPGQGLHPKRDSKGSHLPEIPSSTIRFTAESWQKSEGYLYAIDLFNYGYFWEAHEVLEVLWVDAGKKTPTGIFIQGIIQVSAALLKETQSNHKGALSLADKGLLKLSSQSGVFLGLRVGSFVKEVKSFFAGRLSSPPILILKGI